MHPTLAKVVVVTYYCSVEEAVQQNSVLSKEDWHCCCRLDPFDDGLIGVT
jgi:hypothetical protein